jgi:ABC-type phosphate/phosphonate transport system substrate-binding protein
MIASLPMYDYPEWRADTDQWWAAISGHAGISLPLDRSAEFMAPWHDPGLVFSQTCGYPFTHAFRGQLTLIGTPHYAAPGCDGPLYCSHVLARSPRLEMRPGLTAAVNTADSMSGWLALKLFLAGQVADPAELPALRLSGSHLNSLALLKAGEVDLCAVDAVSLAFVHSHRPALLEGLHRIATTPKVPGLPYVTREANTTRWQQAVAAAMSDKSLAGVRQTLMINGFTTTSAADYDIILELERGLPPFLRNLSM